MMLEVNHNLSVFMNRFMDGLFKTGSGVKLAIRH
jgi:hypothetical protein